MIEFTDTAPAADVDQAEYQRLLGYPRGKEIEGRALELSDSAREWYSAHGRPWLYVRELSEPLQLSSGALVFDGAEFHAAPLRRSLDRAGAHSAILLAASAGVEAELETQKLWSEEKPDEYFFLEMYSSAVVEHLVTSAGARLCAWAENEGMAVLPHYSPGYPDWDVSEARALLALVEQAQPLPSALHALDSGMLHPKKSQLAVFGLTRHTDRVRKLTELTPCQSCSYRNCAYRRVPYTRATRTLLAEVPPALETPEPVRPIDTQARYSVSPKALERWSQERLNLEARADGGVDALFRYEGTTCSNTGYPLKFEYRVTLGPRAERYPIRAQSCAPAPGDEGHRHMCRYIEGPQQIMGAISVESPLAGKALDDVHQWQRPAFGAGCYCEPASREHKWGLVLETIHFALAQKERAAQNNGSNGTS